MKALFDFPRRNSFNIDEVYKFVLKKRKKYAKRILKEKESENAVESQKLPVTITVGVTDKETEKQ